MMPTLTRAPVPASDPPRWYRFHIDCAAPSNKDVSLKGLVKEADAQRKKARLAAAAVKAASGQAAPTSAGGEAAGSGAPGKVGAASLDGVAATSGAAAVAGEGSKPGQQPEQLQGEATGLSSVESRGHSWLDLIERLELKHRGGMPMVANSSDGSVSGDEENENDSEADDDSSDTGSGGGGGNSGGGNGGSGGSGSEAPGGQATKSKPKPKMRQHMRTHSLDYEDPFIDDSLLVDAYYAKEAASKVKTVHTGFFANQGPVATVGSPGGGGDGRSVGGAAGEDASDNDVAVRTKKKKPKTGQVGETAGKGSAVALSIKKKRKTPVETGGTKKVAKVAAAPGSSNPSSSTTGATATASDSPTTSAAGTAAAAAASASSDAGGGSQANGASATATVASVGNGAVASDGAASSTSATVSAATGSVAQPDGAPVVSQATDAPCGHPIEVGAAVVAGENDSANTSSGGSGAGVNETQAGAAGWTSEVEAAVALFEKDCKGWVDGGRPAGDGTQTVLQAMGALDALVRRSAPDAHGKGPYLERLSAVYGQPPAAIKTILATLKERDDKPESARLREAYKTLRSTFETNLDLSIEASGSPLIAPYVWSDGVRLCLHDMMRAFEAWIAKEYGGRLTKKSIDAMKNIFDELALKWPADLKMTGDEIKRLYTNEKRRIRTKAQKEKEAGADTAASASGTPAAGRSSPPPRPVISPPPSAPTTPGGAGAPGSPALAGSPSVPVAVSTPASAAAAASAVPAAASPVPPTASTAASPPATQQQSPVRAQAPETASMSENVGPPRGARFDSPPVFDHRAFEEEEEEISAGVLPQLGFTRRF